MNSRDWGKTQAKRVADAVRKQEELPFFLAKEAVRDLKELTSGTTSKRQLRKLKHPFGRGPSPDKNYVNAGNIAPRKTSKDLTSSVLGSGSRGRLSPLPINRQSGRLRGSITLKSHSRVAYDVSVNTPYASYQLGPGGTKLMIARTDGNLTIMGFKSRGYTSQGILERRAATRTRLYNRSNKI